MRYLFSIIILLGALVVTVSFASGYTASEFVSKYGYEFSKGEQVRVLVTVKGEPEATDPAKLAKEIRYYQSGVLKFIHFAGATNVISDTTENQFTATMITSLAERIAKRYDVVAVAVIDSSGAQVRNICSPVGPGADLAGCDLYAGDFRGADLRNANFSSANLLGADFTGANLSGADLNHGFLKYALLNEANLTNANFDYAKLFRAEITNADLTNSTFYNANLYRVDLTNSNLTNVDFRYAILSHTILASVDLQGANLTNAGTWNANLNDCQNHEICE